jgi:hypothetical protein
VEVLSTRGESHEAYFICILALFVAPQANHAANSYQKHVIDAVLRGVSEMEAIQAWMEGALAELPELKQSYLLITSTGKISCRKNPLILPLLTSPHCAYSTSDAVEVAHDCAVSNLVWE